MYLFVLASQENPSEKVDVAQPVKGGREEEKSGEARLVSDGMGWRRDKNRFRWFRFGSSAGCQVRRLILTVWGDLGGMGRQGKGKVR